MNFYSKKVQILIWLSVLVPMIIIWTPREFLNPNPYVLLTLIASAIIGVLLMLFGSFKNIKEIKQLEKTEMKKLHDDMKNKN